MPNVAISSLTEADALTGDELLEVSQLSSSVTITATTISAAASDNSYNDSGAGFGAAGFQLGDRVRVQGFTGNAANNLFVGVITALTTSKMTIGGTDGDVIVDDAAGESVTISKWETHRTTAQEIADLASGGGGAVTLSGAYVTRGTNQTITTGTNTAVSFSSAVADDLSLWSAGNPTRLTADEAGWYTIGAWIEFAANTDSTRRLISIRLNGSTVITSSSTTSISAIGLGTVVTAAISYKLAAGDYIEVLARHDAAGSVDVTKANASMVRADSAGGGGGGAGADASHAPFSTLTISSNAVTLDLSVAALFEVTLDANLNTITLSNLDPAEANFFTLKVTQDGTGGRSLTVPGSWKFSGGTYVVSSGAGDVDLLQGVSYDNGTTWLVTYSKDFS